MAPAPLVCHAWTERSQANLPQESVWGFGQVFSVLLLVLQLLPTAKQFFVETTSPDVGTDSSNPEARTESRSLEARVEDRQLASIVESIDDMELERKSW